MEETFAYQNKTLFQRFSGHLTTVLTHKKYVAQGCFKLGLYFQGIFHDTSKFSPVEFGTGIKYFDGHRSPNAVERRVNDGCSRSWLHHKGRNRHHFEYWIDFGIRNGELCVYGNRMPMRYLAEMVCDRRAACITYQKEKYTQRSAWEHYMNVSRDYAIMHDDTRIVLENALYIMAEQGEDACFAFVRKLLKITKDADYTAESLGLKDISGFTQKYKHDPAHVKELFKDKTNIAAV